MTIWQMTGHDSVLKKASAAAGFILLVAQEGGSVKAKAAAALYGYSEKALLKAARGGQVIAIRDGTGNLQFPVWQFGPRGGTLPGVKEVLTILAPRTRVDGLTPMSFFLNKTVRLNGLSPIEALRQRGGDRAEKVMQLAIEFME